MIDTITKQAESGILGRYGSDIADYLTSKDTDFSPALAGALLGAGAGALFTAEKPGETSRQRTLRTIRNAILTGALGGIGSQAVGYGLDRAGSAVSGNTDKAAPGGPERSLITSPAAHAATTGLTWLGLKNRQNAHELAHLRNVFGSPKDQAEADSILDKLVVGRKENTGTGFNPQSSWQDVEKKMPGTNLNTGKEGPSGGQVLDFFRRKMQTLQHPTLEEGGKQRSTLDAVAQYVRDKSRLRGGPETVFGDPKLSGSPEQAKATMRNLKSWLKTHGVGGLSQKEKAMQWADRNILANPFARSTSRFNRALGRGVGPASLATGFFLPELAAGVANTIKDDSGTGILTPGIPDVGPTQTQEPSILERLLTRSLF
jgi:hypothetical protein